MAADELFISGIGISRSVVSTIVTRAAERVEGVASVGEKDFASSLVSVFTKNANPSANPVEASVVDDKLNITLHIAVFYGYPFTKLADDVRTAVANAITGQVGYEVGTIDVYIDSLVFPKE